MTNAIGILTSGGDAPGMNAVIASACERSGDGVSDALALAGGPTRFADREGIGDVAVLPAVLAVGPRQEGLEQRDEVRPACLAVGGQREPAGDGEMGDHGRPAQRIAAELVGHELDRVEQESRQAGWGGVLASLAREGSPVSRVQWLERTLPDSGHDLEQWWLDRGDSKAAYARYHVPAPGRPLFQAASANINPRAATKVNFGNDDRAPSLVITPSKNLWHCLGACQAGVQLAGRAAEHPGAWVLGPAGAPRPARRTSGCR